MTDIQDDAQGALDNWVKGQKEVPGKATLTLARFDDQYDLDYVNKPLEDVGPIVLEPRGWTALLGAIGRTVTELGKALSDMDETERPEKVLVAIVTDGQENSSHKYEWSKQWTTSKVFELINHQRDVYKWDFIFLGAGEDVVKQAREIGIPDYQTQTWTHDAAGTHAMASAASSYATSYRTTGKGKFDKSKTTSGKDSH
jgi:hypothetical protein